MSSIQRTDAEKDNLNDSWVELQFQGQIHQLAPPSVEQPHLSKPLSHGAMEKLLLEAQKEWSRTSSRIGSKVGSATSSRGSPRSPRSPTNELSSVGIGEISTIQPVQGGRVLPPEVTTDWFWDWTRSDSSNSGDLSGPKFGLTKKAPLSLRNTKVMRSGPFCLENLPIMLLTHACTFFLGAAVVFVYLKKYCGWSSTLTKATMIAE